MKKTAPIYPSTLLCHMSMLVLVHDMSNGDHSTVRHVDDHDYGDDQ